MQATVGDLKEQLVSKAAVPKERQRLIWRGRVLQDGQLLDEAGELLKCFKGARAARLMTCLSLRYRHRGRPHAAPGGAGSQPAASTAPGVCR